MIQLASASRAVARTPTIDIPRGDPRRWRAHGTKANAFGDRSQRCRREAIDVSQRTDGQVVGCRLQVGHASGIRRFEHQDRALGHHLGQLLECAARVGQMLEHLEQGDDVEAGHALMLTAQFVQRRDAVNHAVLVSIGRKVDPDGVESQHTANRHELAVSAPVIKHAQCPPASAGRAHALQLQGMRHKGSAAIQPVLRRDVLGHEGFHRVLRFPLRVKRCHPLRIQDATVEGLPARAAAHVTPAFMGDVRQRAFAPRLRRENAAQGLVGKAAARQFDERSRTATDARGAVDEESPVTHRCIMPY